MKEAVKDVTGKCGDCGRYIKHDRMKGHLDADYVRLVFVCACNNPLEISLDPRNYNEIHEVLQQAIDRMKLGRFEPVDPNEPEKKHLGA